MNAVTDIADLDAEPLDENVGRAEVRGAARAGEVGLVLLEVVEALALKVGRIVKDGAEDEGLDLKMVAAVRDLAQAYGKVSRSIRQNAMLEDRLEAGLRDRVSGLEDARRARALKRAEAEAAKVAADEEAEFQRVHGDRLAREKAVTEVMQQISYMQRDNPEAAETLDEDWAELLEEGAGYEDFGHRPISETVARLCKALKLEPDWDFFAQEDWAKDEARAGALVLTCRRSAAARANACWPCAACRGRGWLRERLGRPEPSSSPPSEAKRGGGGAAWSEATRKDGGGTRSPNHNRTQSASTDRRRRPPPSLRYAQRRSGRRARFTSAMGSPMAWRTPPPNPPVFASLAGEEESRARPS